MSERLKRSGAA